MRGFDHIDEFREAGTRCQLTLSSYALSAQAYANTPAFRGYLAEAQHRLALKMQDLPHRAVTLTPLRHSPHRNQEVLLYGCKGVR